MRIRKFTEDWECNHPTTRDSLGCACMYDYKKKLLSKLLNCHLIVR